MKTRNIIDELEIKVVGNDTLTHVQRDERFRALTDCAHIAKYKVDGTLCLGVTFENPDDPNIKGLECFCTLVRLEYATFALPWRQGRQIVFIRSDGAWTPALLRKSSGSAPKGSTERK